MSPKGSPLPTRQPVWLSITAGLILTAAFTFFLTWLLGTHRSDLLINADKIQPFMVMKDALRDPSTLLDWYHSPSIYVFPDWILAGLLQALPVSPRLLPLIYGGALLAAYVIAFGWIVHESKAGSFIAGAAIASVTVVALMLGSTLGPHTVAVAMTFSLATQYIHTGAILAGLVIVALVLKADNNFRSGAMVVACMVAAIGAHSDAVLLFWFVLPVAVGMVGYDLLGRSRAALIPAGMLTASAIAGIVFDRLTREFPAKVPSDVGKSLNVWVETLVDTMSRGDFTFPMVVLLCVAMAVRGVVILINVRKTGRDTRSLAELLLIGCSWAALLFPVVTGALIHPSLLRYSLPIFLLPYLWVALLIARLPLSSWLIALATAVWLATGTMIWTPMLQAAGKFAAPKAVTACLTDNGLTQGYSDYWNSKMVMWDSEYAVHLVQLTGHAKLYRFNFNKRWFEATSTGAPFRPTFIATHRLDESRVREAFGEPQRVIECAGQSIWVYDHVLQSPD